MPISVEHVGRVYPKTAPYQVSRAKIVEFATALGEKNPAYYSKHPIAPVTFAAVIAAQSWENLFTDPQLELSLERILHTSQSFNYCRPIKAGDEVQASLRIEKVINRSNTDLFTISVEITTTDGETICTATSQMLHTRVEEA